MHKPDYYARIEAPEMRDYGVYLRCDKLLACQKPLAEMVNADELQFQIVHQVEELWDEAHHLHADRCRRLPRNSRTRIASLR
nr:hypothetical protein [Mesorhizobium ciceri]